MEADLELKALRQRFDQATEAGQVWLFEHNVVTGAVWSNRHRQIDKSLDNKSAASLRGVFLDKLHPEDRPKYINARDEMEVGDRMDQTFRVFRADGEIMYIRMRCSMVMKGGHRHLIGSTMNATGDHEREVALEAANSKLERANEGLNDFVHVLSHDLRSPLRGIRTLLGFVEDESEDSLTPATRSYLNQIDDRVGRMQNLMDDLLEYARVRSDNHIQTLLNPLDIANEIRELVSIPTGLTLSATSSVDNVLVERTPLTTCIRNLVDNALKHHDDTTGAVTIVFSQANGDLCVEVTDDGPGIARRYQKQIFEPFSKLESKDVVEGSGIGLALVQRIVAQSGGALSLESELGVGSTFKITWPLGPKQTTAEGCDLRAAEPARLQ